MTGTPSCRACGAPLGVTFVDLGMSPLANALLDPAAASHAEPVYPLHAFVCAQCFLVQIADAESPERIFADYPYFSSYSDTWREHCARYAAAMVARLGLGRHSRVVEIASNDGCLLQNFVARGIPVLGVEPAANVARAAIAGGVPTEIAFFGRATAARLASADQADLIAANNVLAHVPDINDFVAGLELLLRRGGTITIEVPHVLELIAQRQFDTIYHEHFSYLSLLALESILARHGLAAFDIESIPTHGGSLRVFVAHAGDARGETPALAQVRARERDAGLDRLETYRGFERAVAAAKCDIVGFFAGARRAGARVAGYAAAAKGTTLLNYCGVGREFIDYVVDRSPHKQGRLLPGTHLPIHAPERIFETRPDYVFILAWNLRDEVMRQMAGIRDWGGRFVVPIPKLAIL